VTNGSPTGARRRLGLRLRRLRDDVGITGEEAAAAVDRSASWISRIESGQSGLRARELRDLLDLYRVDDDTQRADLEALAETGRRRAWWSKYTESLPQPLVRYIGFEAEARSIIVYQDTVVPGLLQTTEYMTEIHESAVPPLHPKVLKDRIEARQRRQQLLDTPGGPHLTAIVDEPVLRRVYGTTGCLQRQLQHLLTVSERDSIDVRVVPFAATRIQLDHGFTLLRFDSAPPVAFLETIRGGFLEEGPDADETYGMIVDRLTEATLSAADSRSAMRRALRDLP